jgi:hypothetical protein
MAQPLMPKATAVWLVDNTALTFDQIAEFCGLHALEVKGIADGDVAQGIKGLDPVANGQLTRAEIESGEADAGYRLKLNEPTVKIPERKRKGPRYTPLSKRQERPDAIMWLLRYHPELTDAQVSRLVGTTKPTIQSVRDRTHWNSPNIKPVDPVTLGLCTQIELDEAVKKAYDAQARAAKKRGEPVPEPAAAAAILRPAEETIQEPGEAGPSADEEQPTAASVFGDTPSAPAPAEDETPEDPFAPR